MGAAVVCTLAAAVPIRAQVVPVGDPIEDYARVLGLLGLGNGESFFLRPLAAARLLAGVADSGHPWAGLAAMQLPGAGLRAVPLEIRTAYNSLMPWGQNDGALWQGRGVSGSVSGGAGFRHGGLDVTLAPTLVYAQNADFALIPLAPPAQNSPFAYPYHGGPQGSRIDLPQRFGDASFGALDPGQSQVRFTWRAVLAGAGTHNLWWGPGTRNAIIMSNHAPGFPHAFAGTSRPVNIGIGRLEAQILWGSLRESKYFDTVSTNNARYFTGVVLALQPGALPGLTVGASRVFYQAPPGGFGLADLLRVISPVTKKSLITPSNPDGNDSADQMLSLMARWAPPGSGFEAFVEWARNDHNWDLRDFANEPEHSQAYTVGFQHAARLQDGRIFRLQGELTHLERSGTKEVRASPVYYVHHLVPQGYTQRGQVIGAGIGPGGNAQALGADVFTRWGRVGGFVGRQVHDNDAYYLVEGDTLAYNSHWVELQAGARALMWRGPVEVSADLVLSRHLNHYYRRYVDRTNVSLLLTARWRPARRTSVTGSRYRRCSGKKQGQ